MRRPISHYRGLFGQEIRQDMLPAGLSFHCDACRIVVPSDAPRPAGGDCAKLAAVRMCPFKPKETLVGQFTMAAAAWTLIYHWPLHAAEPDVEAGEYHRQFRFERQAHFAASALRQQMTAEAVAYHQGHHRDGWILR